MRDSFYNLFYFMILFRLFVVFSDFLNLSILFFIFMILNERLYERFIF